MATIDSFESLAQLEDCLGPSAVVTSAVPLMAAYAAAGAAVKMVAAPAAAKTLATGIGVHLASSAVSASAEATAKALRVAGSARHVLPLAARALARRAAHLPARSATFMLASRSLCALGAPSSVAVGLGMVASSAALGGCALAAGPAAAAAGAEWALYSALKGDDDGRDSSTAARALRGAALGAIAALPAAAALSAWGGGASAALRLAPMLVRARESAAWFGTFEVARGFLLAHGQLSQGPQSQQQPEVVTGLAPVNKAELPAIAASDPTQPEGGAADEVPHAPSSPGAAPDAADTPCFGVSAARVRCRGGVVVARPVRRTLRAGHRSGRPFVVGRSAATARAAPPRPAAAAVNSSLLRCFPATVGVSHT